MGRVYYSNSSTSTTTSNSTFQNQVTLTFTPNASKRHLGIWSAVGSYNEGTTDDGIARVRANNLSLNAADQTFAYNNQINSNGNIPRRYSLCGLFIYTSPASPTAQTFAVQHTCSSTGTGSISDTYLTVLELDDNDKAMANVTAVVSTSGTYANVSNTRITCTAGDWLIIASAEAGVSGASYNDGVDPAFTRLHNISSNIEIANTGPHHAGDTPTAGQLAYPLWIISKISLSSNATIGLQFRSSGGTEAEMSETRLIALDLSKFKSHFVDQDYSTTQVSNTTNFTTVETLSSNFLARDNYLQLFACTGKYSIRENGSSGTSNYSINFFENYENGDFNLTTRESKITVADVDVRQDFGLARVAPISQRRAYFGIKANTVVSGGSPQPVANVSNRVVALLQLGDAPREARRISIK